MGASRAVTVALGRVAPWQKGVACHDRHDSGESLLHDGMIAGGLKALSMCRVLPAFGRCVEQGATFIICHPFFLSRGRHVVDDIPTLMEEAASIFPGEHY
jgi:hypothetical protein